MDVASVRNFTPEKTARLLYNCGAVAIVSARDANGHAASNWRTGFVH